MGLKTTKNIIVKFLTQEEPQVLLIQGKWGAGKTHAWNAICQESEDANLFKRYAYVSAFGVSSIDDLRQSICWSLGSRSPKSIRAVFKNAKWNSFQSYIDLIRQFFGLLPTRLTNFLRDLWLHVLLNTKYLRSSGSALIPVLVEEAVICIDDVERMNFDGIAIEELLGLVTSLRDQRRSKVVLICNDEEMTPDAKIKFRKLREKVVDIECLYSPASSEAIDLVFPDNFPNRRDIELCASALQITNIRILRKIRATVEALIRPDRKNHDVTCKQVVSSTVLFSLIIFGSERSLPDVSFIKSFNAFREYDPKGRDADRPAVKGWIDLLRRYGFFAFDDLDAELLRIVEHGHAFESNVLEEMQKLDERAAKQETKDKFFSAWRLFHYSLADNAEEMVAAMSAAVLKNPHLVSAGNLSGTVGLFREIGFDQEATALVDAYVQAHRGDIEFFDLRNSLTAMDVRDDYMKKAFQREVEEYRPTLPLKSAILELANGNANTIECIRVLTNASIEEIESVFLSDLGDNLHRCIEACLATINNPQFPNFAMKVATFINQQSNLNLLNKARLKRHLSNVKTILGDIA